MTGITQAQRDALARLVPALEAGTYLAGGVAVGLSLGHRDSLDLDLFVPAVFDEERLAGRIAAGVAGARLVGRARGTLHLEVAGVPVSILAYGYPLLAPPVLRADLPVPVASEEDLACMKLSAIAGRGAAKDFWDLEAMLERGVAGGTLQGALELYARKYASEDPGHVVRSLAYFGDADAAPLPRGLEPAAWQSIKGRMSARVQAL